MLRSIRHDLHEVDLQIVPANPAQTVAGLTTRDCLRIRDAAKVVESRLLCKGVRVHDSH